MFVDACLDVHESIYGLMATTPLPPNQIRTGTGSGFMIAPGVIATAAHVCHVDGNRAEPLHAKFEAIRGPDVARLPMETAVFIAEHPLKDIALLRIENPRSNGAVSLNIDRVETGRSVGSLGFPLASVEVRPHGIQFNAFERFQGAYISAFRQMTDGTGNNLDFYETDALMYPGSSGCPGFLVDGGVIGMQVMSLNENALNPHAAPTAGARTVSISLWVPAEDIREFAVNQGVIAA